MTARILVFPPNRVRRMVAPVSPHGSGPYQTGLAALLSTYLGIPEVMQGFNPDSQYQPLVDMALDKIKARKPAKPRKPKA